MHFFINETFREEAERISGAFHPQITFSCKKTGTSEKRFMIRVFREIRKKDIDVLILNSVDSKHILWYGAARALPGLKIIFNVHDANNLFKSTFRWSIKPAFRHVGKKWLIRQTDGFIVNTEPMKQYLEKGLTVKPVWWIPPVVFDGNREQAIDSSPVKIIIPGSIDHRRRAYDEVLSIYNSLRNEMESVPELILAGQPYGDYGKRIIEQVRKINLEGGNIIYYEKEIPEPEFEKLFITAQLIWSPLVIQTSILDNIPEIYGETKNSGNTHDAIRFARPMMIPAGLKTAKELNSSLIIYTDRTQCINQIKRFVADKSWRDSLGEQALKNALCFTADKVRKQFDRMLTDISAL